MGNSDNALTTVAIILSLSPIIVTIGYIAYSQLLATERRARIERGRRMLLETLATLPPPKVVT